MPKGCLTRWHLEDLPSSALARRAEAVSFLAAKPGAVPPEPRLGDVTLHPHHHAEAADGGAWHGQLAAVGGQGQGHEVEGHEGQGQGQGQGQAYGGGFNAGGGGPLAVGAGGGGSAGGSGEETMPAPGCQPGVCPDPIPKGMTCTPCGEVSKSIGPGPRVIHALSASSTSPQEDLFGTYRGLSSLRVRTLHCRGPT